MCWLGEAVPAVLVAGTEMLLAPSSLESVWLRLSRVAPGCCTVSQYEGRTYRNAGIATAYGHINVLRWGNVPVGAGGTVSGSGQSGNSGDPVGARALAVPERVCTCRDGYGDVGCNVPVGRLAAGQAAARTVPVGGWLHFDIHVRDRPSCSPCRPPHSVVLSDPGTALLASVAVNQYASRLYIGIATVAECRLHSESLMSGGSGGCPLLTVLPSKMAALQYGPQLPVLHTAVDLYDLCVLQWLE